MKKLKKALIVFAIMAVALTAVNLAPVAMAQGLISPNDNVVAGPTNGEGDIREFAKTILNFILGFLGFIAVVYIIYGGFLYIMSGGDDANVEKGKKIILNAAIGIIIILASFAIVNTVLRAPTGVSSQATSTSSV
jgi:hypothetical protein